MHMHHYSKFFSLHGFGSYACASSARFDICLTFKEVLLLCTVVLFGHFISRHSFGGDRARPNNSFNSKHGVRKTQCESLVQHQIMRLFAQAYDADVIPSS